MHALKWPIHSAQGQERRQSGGEKYPQHARILGEDFEWRPEVELYCRGVSD